MVRVGWSTAAVSPAPMTLAQTPEQLVRVEFVHADMCVPAASPTDSTYCHAGRVEQGVSREG